MNRHILTCNNKKYDEIEKKYKSEYNIKLLDIKKQYDNKEKEITKQYEKEIKKRNKKNKSLIYNLNKEIESKKLNTEKITERFEEDILRLDSQIINLENEIDDYKQQMYNLASKPTNVNTTKTVNNTQNINLDKLTDEYMIQKSDNLTLDDIMRGASGYANFAISEDGPLHNRIRCTDYGRQMIEYLDEKGNTVRDPKMTKLIRRYCEAIATKNAELCQKYWVELNHSEMGKDKISELQNLMLSHMNGIKNGTKGERTILVNQIINELCSLTYK